MVSKISETIFRKRVVLAITKVEVNVNRLVSENSETNRATMRLDYFVIQRSELVQDNT